MPPTNPTAMVAWAQRDPGWGDGRANSWRDEVATFATALRQYGVDAIVDLHFESERGMDWTRFGPRAIQSRDWVIVALSPAWRDRWEGHNDPTNGAGAAGEADALRSIFAENQQLFREKLVLVTLPSMASHPNLVPNGLHGVQRRTVRGFELNEMAELLRLLTGQAAYPAAPLGDVPDLPPALPGSAWSQQGVTTDRYALARAVGDAETELLTVVARLRDAQADGRFPLGFILPADRRQVAVDQLENADLTGVRRIIDNAYIACDRLNTRLQGRFWDSGPMPDPGPAHICESDRLQETIDSVEAAIEALAGVPRPSAQTSARAPIEGASDEARTRLDDLDAATDLASVLDAPRRGRAMHARAMASIVRVSLIDPSPAFIDWVHDPEALTLADMFLRTGANDLNDRDWSHEQHLQPARTTMGGHSGSIAWDGLRLREMAVGWDRSGIGGVRMAGVKPDDTPYKVISSEIRDQWLRTALRYLLDCVVAASVSGRAVVRWDFYGCRTSEIITLRPSSNLVASHGSVPAHYNNMVAVEVEAQLAECSATEIAEQLWIQLKRLAGARPMS